MVSSLTAAPPQEQDTDSPESAWKSLARRVNISEVQAATRFNYMDRGPGAVTSRGLQYRLRVGYEVELAGEGATYFAMRAETGPSFDSSWNNSGIGRDPVYTGFHVKSFYLGQKIGRHLELQAGGLDFDRGPGTDHLAASEDGYLVGYRLIVRGKDHAWTPDRTVVTIGHTESFHQPDLFKNLHFASLSYMQLLVQKKIGDNATVEADINSIRNVWLTRQALKLEDVWAPVIDEAIIELIQRTSQTKSIGWSAVVTHPFDRAKRWKLEVIYADVPNKLFFKDGEPILINREELEFGKHFALGAVWRPHRATSVGVFAGRQLDHSDNKRWIAQAFVTYDYAGLLNRLKQ